MINGKKMFNLVTQWYVTIQNVIAEGKKPQANDCLAVTSYTINYCLYVDFYVCCYFLF